MNRYDALARAYYELGPRATPREIEQRANNISYWEALDRNRENAYFRQLQEENEVDYTEHS